MRLISERSMSRSRQSLPKCLSNSAAQALRRNVATCTPFVT